MTHLAWNDACTARQYGQRRDTARASLPERCVQIASAAIALIVACTALIARWNERARQRRALGQLDDYMLRDIGVTRYDAKTEAEKPFWR